jgi:hypothetical protein
VRVGIATSRLGAVAVAEILMIYAGVHFLSSFFVDSIEYRHEDAMTISKMLSNTQVRFRLSYISD